MDNEQKNRSVDDMPEVRRAVSRTAAKRKQRKGSFLRKAGAVALSAAIFGSVASGSFLGVNKMLDQSQTVAEQTEDVVNKDVSLSALSYTADSTSQSLDVSGVAAKGLSSVVSVTNISVQEVRDFYNQFGRNGRGQAQTQETTSCGSGVIVSSSDSALYMITNYHVVEDAATLSVTFADDQTYDAQMCGYDEAMDIALLKVSVDDLSADTRSQISVVSTGDSDELAVGEQVVAIGNALGYGQSVTTGIVSALNRTVSTDTGSSVYIQTDAAINPGNSGGALFNMNGELVGINTVKVSSTDVEGMGYAIPISQVLERISSLMNE